jgi:hypothetical protein
MLLKHKWIIISFVSASFVISFSYFMLPFVSKDGQEKTDKVPVKSLYRSDCMLETSTSIASSDTIIRTVLMSTGMPIKIAKINNLRKICYEIRMEKGQKEVYNCIYIGHDNKWSHEDPSNLTKLGEVVTVSIRRENNLIIFDCISEYANVSEKIVNTYLDQIAQMTEPFRKRDIKQLTSKQLLYRKLIDLHKDPFLKARISEQFVGITENLTHAQDLEHYGYVIISPPTPAERIKAISNDTASVVPNKKNRNLLVVMFFALTSFFMSILVILFIEYMKKLKYDDRARFDELKKSIGLKNNIYRGQ